MSMSLCCGRNLNSNAQKLQWSDLVLCVVGCDKNNCQCDQDGEEYADAKLGSEGPGGQAGKPRGWDFHW